MNNAIKITIGGNEYPLKFGMYAAQAMAEFNDRFAKLDTTGYYALVYGGMCNAALLEEREEPTPEFVMDLVDEMALDTEGAKVILQQVNDCFLLSKMGRAGFEELKKNGEKELTPAPKEQEHAPLLNKETPQTPLKKQPRKPKK